MGRPKLVLNEKSNYFERNCLAQKELGSNSETVAVSILSISLLVIITFIVGLNSAKTCRQIPQGVIGFSESDIMAIA